MSNRPNTRTAPRNAWLLVLAVVTVVVLAATVKQLTARETSPHDGEADCGVCHLNSPETAAESGEKMLLVQDVDKLCQACHEMDPGLSHPSHVTSTREIPPEFPLDWAGRLVCTTCHYTHREGHSDKTGYMIRTESIGRQLCERCHPDLGSRGGGKHAASFNRTHLDAALAVNARSGLDRVSLECLGCHDGTIAKMKSAPVARSGSMWEHSSIGLSHPIGVDYPPRSAGRTKYRAREAVDPRIRFFDGKLGCCSCHEAFFNEKHGLVMSNNRSALCLECHDM